jgi:acyl-CoA reductase-like NAD-dependent aldehyde dehydrogenase
MDAAVQAARAAFPGWAGLPGAARSQCLLALAGQMEADVERLADLLTREQGKPLGESMGEVMGAAAMIRYFAGLELADEVLHDDEITHIVIKYAPLGVVAIITPWNSPVLMLANKLAPALRAGNTVVCKPAATTPLTTLAIGALCAEIFPAGVVNVVADANDLGAYLTTHPGIDKISFTGSTAIGRKVMANAALGLKSITLELGSNDAAIVLDDADPAAIAPQILQAAMRNAGQVCLATKRAYVPDRLYNDVCARLAVLSDAIAVGNGLDKGVEMGPIQNQVQFDEVRGFLDVAAQDGVVIAGGAALDGPGFFIAPTIVRDISPDSVLVTEEQFGPILPVICYSNIEEVIAQLNASPYGLGGTVWCGDVERGRAVASRIEPGIIWVNKYFDLRFDVSIGGVKQSGVGVEMGRDGLLAYMRRTVVNSVPKQQPNA